MRSSGTRVLLLVLVSTVIDYSTSWDVMVMAPWEYTVERPLGDL